jgi:hypothetical protein
MPKRIERIIDNEDFSSWINKTIEALQIEYDCPSVLFELEGRLDDVLLFVLDDDSSGGDLYDAFMTGFQFGQRAEVENFKLYHTCMGSVQCFFPAKNVNELKQRIKTAIEDWKQDVVKPEPKESKLTSEKRILALVKDLIDAFPEHDTDEEVNGAEAVDTIMDFISRVKKEI